MTQHPSPGWGFQQMGWLLQEVKAAGGDIPSRYHASGHNPTEWKSARIARSNLGQSISWAFTTEVLTRDLKSEPKARQRLDALGRLEGQLNRSIEILDNDKTLSGWVADQLRLTLPDYQADDGYSEHMQPRLHDILISMRRLRDVAKARQDFLGSAPLGKLEANPQEVLLVGLAKAYRKGLDAEPMAGMKKSYNAYHGPFPAFVCAAYYLEGRAVPEAAALTKSIQRYIERQGLNFF